MPPWELQQQPVIWQEWALIFEAAEDGARQGPQTGGSLPSTPGADPDATPAPAPTPASHMLGNR